MESFNRKVLILTALVSLAIGFGGGFWFVSSQGEIPPTSLFQHVINREAGQPQDVDFGLFWTVWDALHRKYVDKQGLDTRELVYGAISGMVNSVGDPYTVFFEPVLSKKFQEEISGSFNGVGMEIGKRNDILTIIAPLKGTPAFRAGLKPGDKVLKIDSKPTTDMSVEEAVNLIRGPRGSKVTLTILKTDSSESQDITIIRDTIKISAVSSRMLDGHIGYIELHTFNQNITTEFKRAIAELEGQGIERLIIDLRNNPGGLLDASVELAGWFVEKGSIVTIQDFGNSTRNEFRATGNAALKRYPTVVLINGGSASASEILAGALKDNLGIKLVGEKTFGKGSVQELERFSDGSSLKVTIAKWLTPNGVSISDKGIEPTIKVELDEKKVTSGEIEMNQPGKDPQLDKAIEIIKNL